jgi:hypothetical protein
LAFDICLGVSSSFFLVAAIGFTKMRVKLGCLELILLACSYMVMPTALVFYAVTQRYQVLREDNPTANLALGSLAAFVILAFSVLLFAGSGLCLLHYLYIVIVIYRRRIRNPLSVEDRCWPCCFGKRRKAVTLEDAELMMKVASLS